jgi:hypothetical protein
MSTPNDGIAWLSDVNNLVDDAVRQLDALNTLPLTDGMVHETERPRAIKFLDEQIQEIRGKRPKGLWDYADKFRKLGADFDDLKEREKSRPRWTPPSGNLLFFAL